MSNYSEKIYETDKFILSIVDNALVLELLDKNSLLISSWHNGGYNENMSYVVNQSLTPIDYPIIEKISNEKFQIKRFKELGLNPEKSTGLITSAAMDNYAISTKTYEKLSVTSIVTAGADKNAVKAGDPASFYEYNHNYKTIGGTINIITYINANLEPGALTTASITMTEAKTSVLEDLKIESQYSNKIATGTGTDGLCVISDKSSHNHLENAGKHSKLGELIANSIRDALYEALYLQTYMCPEYQKTVLSRLSRFNVSYDDLFDQSLEDDILIYSELFYDFNKSGDKIAWVSSVINLIDEVQSDLLTLSDVSKTIINLTNVSLKQNKKSAEFKSIDETITYLIESINEYLYRNRK